MIALEEFRKRVVQTKSNLLKRANGHEHIEMVDKIVAIDKECRSILSQIELLRSQRNKKVIRWVN